MLVSILTLLAIAPSHGGCAVWRSSLKQCSLGVMQGPVWSGLTCLAGCRRPSLVTELNLQRRRTWDCRTWRRASRSRAMQVIFVLSEASAPSGSVSNLTHSARSHAAGKRKKVLTTDAFVVPEAQQQLKSKDEHRKKKRRI